MGAVTYLNERVVEFIERHLVPIQVLLDSQPLATNFNIQWTPILITLDEEGKEHHRTIGFLSPEGFIPSLMLGVAKCHFDRGKFNKAIAMIEGVLKDYTKSDAAPEAVYLRGEVPIARSSLRRLTRGFRLNIHRANGQNERNPTGSCEQRLQDELLFAVITKLCREALRKQPPLMAGLGICGK